MELQLVLGLVLIMIILTLYGIVFYVLYLFFGLIPSVLFLIVLFGLVIYISGRLGD